MLLGIRVFRLETVNAFVSLNIQANMRCLKAIERHASTVNILTRFDACFEVISTNFIVFIHSIREVIKHG